MTNTTSPTERVGRYQLLEPIGFGPSGAVSRAKVFGVAGFERQFAVKRFHAELTATAAMAAMMSAAARAYGSLEHPRIARMSEFGVAQGSTFTAVELVVGLDALRLISEVRLTGVTLAAGGALALVSQAARAVGYAHGRGLTHLGLAPTNVIVTADGDIKITDFGILSATLPQRPIEAPRLAQRIPYLAPEQLANEATSAATDVFALGVLAYELVTGSRTFKGDTPQQVASAIMAGPPAEPPLPRPIVRVLQRCLARSPFERFPDARALADALDAALRVAPVPGTRKDVGAQVKETLDRLAALNEGQMSGVVALHLGTGPIRRPGEDTRAASQAEPDPETVRETGESLAYELSRPDAQPGGPLAFGGSATTQQDLPRPMTTVPGLAPPPIPVPQGVGGPPTTPMGAQPGANTLLGMGKTPPAIPSVKPRTGSVVSSLPSKPPAVPTAAVRPPPRPGTDLAIPQEPVAAAPPVATTESAVHPLDPSELVPFDSPSGDAVDLDAIEDQVPPNDADGADAGWTLPPASASSPPPAAAGKSPPAAAPRPPPIAASPPSGAASTPTTPAAAARSPYRLDPSSVDTKPIAPLVLEPLLFDPINRRSAPGVTSGLEDDIVTFDESNRDRPPPGQATGDAAGAGAPGGSQPPPAAASPATQAASSDPRLGKTILGFASPLPLPLPQARVATPPPTQTPSLGTNRPPPEPADEISEIALEGFRAAAGPDRPAAEPWSHEPPERDPGAKDPRAAHADLAATIPPSSHPDLPPPGFPNAPSQSGPMPPGFPSAPNAPPQSGPMPPGWVSAPPPPRESRSATYRAARPRRPMAGIIAGMVGAAIVGVAAWQIYVRVIAPPTTHGTGSGRHVQMPGDAQVATIASDAGTVATSRPADAAQIASLPIDAGTAVVVTAPPADAARVAATPPTDAASTAVAIAPPSDARIAAAPPADAARVAAAPPADAARIATTPPGDAARVAAASPDAGAPPSDARLAPSDATQVAAVNPAVPTSPSDTLSIASTPPGARVFLDGADTGATPLKLPGTPDRHTIALLLAGHELYVAQVDGHGTFQIPLKEVTPSNGPAGIKVLRCKDKDRYYVSIDGKPTGQTCPTERIGCELGPHTVEVYDVVSETRRKWDIVVKETRLSFRVRVE